MSMSMAGRVPATETEVVPSLAKVCTRVLIRHRDLLRDVGWLDVNCLRHVTSHCNAEQLARVEDFTKQGSDRDISWYTWDCWYRFYEQKFGAYRPGSMGITPLPGTQPPDYVPPVAVGAPTADWRRMLERDLANEKQRAAQISNRLRNMYDKAQKEKASRSTEVCIIKPPAKRKRTATGPSSSAVSSAPVEKAKAKMLHDIGMSSSANKKSNSWGGKDVRQVGRTHKVQVTRTVVLHKASSPAASSRASMPASQPASTLGGGGASALAGSGQGGTNTSASAQHMSGQAAAQRLVHGSAARPAPSGSVASGQKRPIGARPEKGDQASQVAAMKPSYASPIALYKSS